jgi:aspartate carbamoyltransferase catalytic subunit
MLDHLVSVDDLDEEIIEDICNRASEFHDLRLNGGLRRHPESYETLRGRVMIADFFEPSTRTRFSFEAAMSYLGGKVIGTENAAEFSSFKKGESLADNFRVISGYGDIVVGRFQNEGDARIAADACLIPLINGGDGTGEHPTQALIDYYTIVNHFGEEMPDIITFLGDNKRSRTVRSLAKLLASFSSPFTVQFVNPKGLEPPQDLLDELEANEVDTIICNDIRDPDILTFTDVLYVTRAQNERSDEQYNGHAYSLDQSLVDELPDDSIIMHPLPRNSEIPAYLDQDHRAKYFEQAHNGLYVRMGLLELMLET